MKCLCLSVFAVLSLAQSNVAHAAILEQICTESPEQATQGDMVEKIGSLARVTLNGKVYEVTMTTQPNSQGIYTSPVFEFEDEAKNIIVKMGSTPVYQTNSNIQIGTILSATVIQAGVSTELNSCTNHFSNQPIDI